MKIEKLKGGNLNMNKAIFGIMLLTLIVFGSLASVIAMADIAVDTRTGILGDRVEVRERAKIHADEETEARIEAYHDARIERFQNLRARSVAEISEDTDEEVEIDSEESLEDSILDIDAEINSTLRASSFAIVSSGTGWATNSEEGHFLRILFVEKEFTNTENNETELRSKGVLKIGTDRAYRLDLESYSDSELEFSVMNGDEELGSLVLTEEKDLNGFRVWAGTFDSGGAEWELDLATRTSRTRGEISGSIDGEVRGQGNGNGLGFFARLRGFFGAN